MAGFIGNPGMNVFATELQATDGGGCAIKWGEQLIPLVNDPASGDDWHSHIGKRLYAGLRPEAFCDAATCAMRVPAEIESVEALGHESLVYFRSGASALDTDSFGSGSVARSHMVARLNGAVNLKVGEKIELGIVSKQLTLFNENGDVLKCA